jgi:hypothetical protein
MRKGLAVELQQAFITLIKTSKEEEVTAEEQPCPGAMQEWTTVKKPHPKYPAASASISIRHDPNFGRHVVATKAIAAGDIVFNEAPIVSCLNRNGAK